MAKILFILAQENYQDKEFLNTKKEVEEGNEIIVASKTTNLAKGVLGGSYHPDLSIKTALDNIDEYDVLIIVGGGGAQKYFNDQELHELIKKMHSKGKLIAAICIAPKILAITGILKGKNVTVWDPGDESVIDYIISKGAEYIDEAVVEDENIITANGPSAATEFGKKIQEKINEGKTKC